MAEHDSLIGRQIGRYQIEKLIGRGGMASVYRALDVSLGRPVAMKIIHQGIALSGEGLLRFKQEAALIIQLEHAHLIPVYDYNVEHDPPYIVMRYVAGGTLAEVIKEKRAVPLTEIAHVFNQIAGALEYAHQSGVIHRDIKPSNIMIDRSGSAFLTDFGIARMAGATAMTATSMAVGTPGYMSPEQGQSSRTVDYRTDIYALGVILFEMATGQSPYTGDDPLNLLVAHLTQPIPSAQAINRALPDSFDFVIQKALAKHPEDRYNSVLALTHDVEMIAGGRAAANATPTMLQRIAEDSAITSPTRPESSAFATGGLQYTSKPVRGSSGYRWTLFAVGGITIILLALIGLVLSGGGNDGEDATPVSTNVAAAQVEDNETNDTVNLTTESEQTQVAVDASLTTSAQLEETETAVIDATRTAARSELAASSTALAATDAAVISFLTDTAPTPTSTATATLSVDEVLSTIDALATDEAATQQTSTSVARATSYAINAQEQRDLTNTVVARSTADAGATLTAEFIATADAGATLTAEFIATADAGATLTAEFIATADANETAIQLTNIAVTQAFEIAQMVTLAPDVTAGIEPILEDVTFPEGTDSITVHSVDSLIVYAVDMQFIGQDDLDKLAEKLTLATDGGLEGRGTRVLRPILADVDIFRSTFLMTNSVITVQLVDELYLVVTQGDLAYVYSICSPPALEESFECFVPLVDIVQSEVAPAVLTVDSTTEFRVTANENVTVIRFVNVGVQSSDDVITLLGKATVDGTTWYYINYTTSNIDRNGWLIGDDVTVTNESLVPEVDPDNPDGA